MRTLGLTQTHAYLWNSKSTGPPVQQRKPRSAFSNNPRVWPSSTASILDSAPPNHILSQSCDLSSPPSRLGAPQKPSHGSTSNGVLSTQSSRTRLGPRARGGRTPGLLRWDQAPRLSMAASKPTVGKQDPLGLRYRQGSLPLDQTTPNRGHTWHLEPRTQWDSSILGPSPTGALPDLCPWKTLGKEYVYQRSENMQKQRTVKGNQTITTSSLKA